MNENELITVAKECQRLARMLANRQSSESVVPGVFWSVKNWINSKISGRLSSYILPADTTTKLVNALLDSGNRLEVIAAEGFYPKGKK